MPNGRTIYGAAVALYVGYMIDTLSGGGPISKLASISPVVWVIGVVVLVGAFVGRGLTISSLMRGFAAVDAEPQEELLRTRGEASKRPGQPEHRLFTSFRER
jgi:hypothetical protein